MDDRPYFPSSADARLKFIVECDRVYNWASILSARLASNRPGFSRISNPPCILFA